MHPLLAECDRIGRRIYPYTDDTNTGLVMLTAQDDTVRKQWDADVARAKQERTALYERFRAIAPTLSVSEIVEGFMEGGALLRQMLSGWMGAHHDAAYVPLMLQAIREGEPHVGQHCLSWLVPILGHDLAPLIMELVRKDWHPLQVDALYVAGTLQLEAALPYVDILASHPNPELAERAESIRYRFREAPARAGAEESDA